MDKCDALDGLMQDTLACQKACDLNRDVPTCGAARDGTCLSAAQKSGIGALFAGAKTESGATIYTSFPWDARLATAGWASWKFTSPAQRDAGAIAFIWQAPPAALAGFDGNAFGCRA